VRLALAGAATQQSPDTRHVRLRPGDGPLLLREGGSKTATHQKPHQYALAASSEGALTRRNPPFPAGFGVELGGFEPPTSWVRSSSTCFTPNHQSSGKCLLSRDFVKLEAHLFHS
jgi:hypothetical protein